jgi:glutathione synthase/RimK-type ligase-like ATP-grasp enzyme
MRFPGRISAAKQQFLLKIRAPTPEDLYVRDKRQKHTFIEEEGFK